MNNNNSHRLPKLNAEQQAQFDFIYKHADTAQQKLLELATDASLLAMAGEVAETHLKKIPERDYFLNKQRSREVKAFSVNESSISAVYEVFKSIGIVSQTVNKDLSDSDKARYTAMIRGDDPEKPLKREDIDKVVLTMFNEGYINSLTKTVPVERHQQYQQYQTNIKAKFDIQEEFIVNAIANESDHEWKRRLTRFHKDYQLHRDGMIEQPLITKEMRQRYEDFRYFNTISFETNPMSKKVDDINANFHIHKIVRKYEEKNDNVVVLKVEDNGSKAPSRSLEKGIKEKDGNFNELTDIARARIVYNDLTNLKSAIFFTRELAEQRGHILETDLCHIKAVETASWNVKNIFSVNIGNDQNGNPIYFKSELQYEDIVQALIEKPVHKIYENMRSITGTERRIDERGLLDNCISFIEQHNSIPDTLPNGSKTIRLLMDIELNAMNSGFEGQTLSDLLNKHEQSNIAEHVTQSVLDNSDSLPTHMKTEIENLYNDERTLHQFIICAAMQSFDNDKHYDMGLTHPSVAALFTVLAERFNKKAEAKGIETIPEDWMPKQGEDFRLTHYNEAKSFVESELQIYQDKSNPRQIINGR